MANDPDTMTYGRYLALDDLLSASLHLIPVTAHNMLEERDQFLRAAVTRVHVVLDRPNGGGSKNLADIAAHDLLCEPMS